MITGNGNHIFHSEISVKFCTTVQDYPFILEIFLSVEPKLLVGTFRIYDGNGDDDAK